MASETQLDPKSQRHLDAYLGAVSAALQRSGQTQSVIQGILSDIRTQVFDMLRARAGDAPTEDDVCTVIAQLDAPESYAEGAGSPAAVSPAQLASTPHSAASGVAEAAAGVGQVSAGPSGKATASLILGILGVPTCGLLGVVAIIVGLMAQADIRRSAGRLKGAGVAIAGIVVGALSLVMMLPAAAIFVAISLPNFFEAQTRARVARTKAELRVMEFGVEAYKIDHGTYPARADQITTPVAYVSSVPRDVFAEEAERDPSLVYAPLGLGSQNGRMGFHGFILLGRGPDCTLSIDPARDLPIDKPLKPDEMQSILLPKTYDPTNGTNSAGDIVGTWTLPDSAKASIPVKENRAESGVQSLVATPAITDSPLHAAAKNGEQEKVGRLIEGGLNVDAPNVEGQTALHIAAANGHRQLAEFLQRKGARIGAVDRERRTSLHLAAAGGHQEMAALLVEMGAAMEATDALGRTPLGAAEANGHEGLAEFLRGKWAERAEADRAEAGTGATTPTLVPGAERE